MFNQEVFKTWSLILQLGLSILVPIFLLIAVSIFLNNKFGIDIILVMTLVGVVVGIRNGYVLIRSYLKSSSSKSESELIKKHKKEFNS